MRKKRILMTDFLSKRIGRLMPSLFEEAEVGLFPGARKRLRAIAKELPNAEFEPFPGIRKSRFFRLFSPCNAMSPEAYQACFGEDVDFAACRVHHAFCKEVLNSSKYLSENAFVGLRGLAAEVDEKITSFRPDCIIIYHGFFYIDRIFIAKAAKHRIPVLFTEMSIFHRAGLILDPYAPFFMPALNAIERHWKPELPLTGEQSNAIELFLDRWCKERKSKYVVNESKNEVHRLETFLSKDKTPVALLALQVPTDMNVMLSMPKAFGANYRAWVQALLDAFPSDWRLIVRPHPKSEYEPMVSGDNKLRSSDTNLHDLLCGVDCVITLSSNVGLEAIMMNLPLIAPKSTYYTGKGLSLDLNDLSELPALLERARSFRPPEPLRSRFLHHVALDYCLYPDEFSKLEQRLSMAQIPSGKSAFFDLLPADYHAYKTLVENGEGARSATLEKCRQDFDWPDAWMPNFGGKMRRRYRKLCKSIGRRVRAVRKILNQGGKNDAASKA